MKGYASHYSPFARKVRVAAIETGQGEAIDWTMVDLLDRPAVLGQTNPLDQVPVIVMADGAALYDSPVICQYLDSLHNGSKLYPPDGPARWTALRLEALGDGLAAACAAIAGERRRPEDRRHDPFIVGQSRKIDGALAALEDEVDRLDGPLGIAQIAAACAIGYMEVRECAPGWREPRPRLAAWYDAFRDRPSMRRTAPPDP